MAKEVHEIEVQLADNEIVPAKIFLWDEAPEDQDLVKLTLQFSGKEISSTDQTYFGALCSIRKILETEGALLRCYGASKNVYPSGMSLDMGRGYKAYKMTMGSQGKLTDLVSIFDMGPDVTPATVDEQKKFRDAWFESLS